MSFKNLAIFAVVAAGVCFLASSALNAQERQECARWMNEARESVGWYSLDWQRAQCHAYGVTLPDMAEYIERLKTDAPETLRAPMREEFTDEAHYQKAADRFEAFGYWATEPQDWK